MLRTREREENKGDSLCKVDAHLWKPVTTQTHL